MAAKCYLERMTDALGYDLKFQLLIVIRQLRACNTQTVLSAKFEDSVADEAASVYRLRPQTEPYRTRQKAIAAAREIP